MGDLIGPLGRAPAGLDVDENVDGLTIRARENVLLSPSSRRRIRIATGVLASLAGTALTVGSLGLSLSSAYTRAPVVLMVMGGMVFVLLLALSFLMLTPLALLVWTLVRLDQDATWVDLTIGSQGVVIARPGGQANVVFPPDATLEVSVRHVLVFPILVLSTDDREEVVPVFGRATSVEWMADCIRERVAAAGDRSGVPETLRHVRGLGRSNPSTAQTS